MSVDAASEAEPLRVRVWYDFASTLCYVGYRVMGRMDDCLAELRVQLDWAPLDLSQLLYPYRRGRALPEARLENARRVARDLAVDVQVPREWPDSRAVGAAALVAEAAGRGPGYRERVFTALFEERRSVADTSVAAELARDLGLYVEPAEIEAAKTRLHDETEAAREAMVTGVPTFMFGEWPFGGIQTEDTMRQLLERWARRQRGNP